MGGFLDDEDAVRVAAAKSLAECAIDRLQQQGNLVEAESVLKECVSILDGRRYEKGRDGILAATLGMLGECLLDTGIEQKEGDKMKEAEGILRRGLVAAELDGEDSAIANALSELSRCLREQGYVQMRKLGESEELKTKLGEAAELLGRCLEVREAKLGPDDDKVVGTRLEWGICLSEAMRPAEAVHALRQYLAIQDAKLDPSDIQIARALRPLAVCLSRMGKPEEAQGALRRCLAIQEAKMCEDVENLSFTLHLLGLHLLESGELTEAQEKLRRSSARLGPGHCLVISTELELAICRRVEDQKVSCVWRTCACACLSLCLSVSLSLCLLVPCFLVSVCALQFVRRFFTTQPGDHREYIFFVVPSTFRRVVKGFNECGEV